MSIVIFLLSVLGIRTVNDVGGFENQSWMSQISDSKYISEISIPGTHDTCAHYEPVYAMIKCQDYTLKDQLDMGVRFLDIRGALIVNKMLMMHNVIPQAMFFDEVLEICYEFLQENPTETIIMSIKQEAGENLGEFIEYVENTVNKNEDFWYTENSIPMLSQVRGKIVLFNRYEGEQTDFGISTHRWVDDDVFTVNNEEFNIHIQDYYCVLDNELKWSRIQQHYESCLANANKNNLFVNFISGYSGDVPNIAAVSDYMNPRLMQYMQNAADGCYGITVMDFATQEFCDIIIDKNF